MHNKFVDTINHNLAGAGTGLQLILSEHKGGKWFHKLKKDA